MDLIGLAQILGYGKLRRDAREYAHAVREQDDADAHARRNRAERPSSASVLLGTDQAGRPFPVPINEICAPGLVGGGTGAGKSVGGIINPATALRTCNRFNGGVGIIDNKTDTFQVLAEQFRDDGHEPPIVLDFAGAEPVSYGLLIPRLGERPDDLVDRRMDVFDDFLGRDGRLSLLMSRMLRNLLLLMTEQGVPFPLLEMLLTFPDALQRLAEQSADFQVRDYVQNDFPRERQTTLLALKARLDSLLRHRVLRLSFGADGITDLRAAMDGGKTVLINAGGPMLPQGIARLIKSLVVSDVKQATFLREERQRPFVWFVDEAQTLFQERSNVENITTMLTMARSFGTSLVLVTQSLVAVCPNQDFMLSLQTNFRWLMLFRSGLKDAALIEPALPVGGLIVGRRSVNGAVSYLTVQQEANARMRAITDLPSRQAYFWSRGTGRPATLLTMPTIRLSHHGRDGQRTGSAETTARIQRHLEEHEQRLRELARPRRQTHSKQDLDEVLAGLERQLKETSRP